MAHDDAGPITIPRSFFRAALWREDRLFSPAEAFLDMIALASPEPDTVVIDGSMIELLRGELAASLRWLARRWSWSKSKVARWLGVRQSCGEIGTRTETDLTVITLCHYDLYAPPEFERGTVSGTVAGQSRDKLELRFNIKTKSNINSRSNGGCGPRSGKNSSDPATFPVQQEFGPEELRRQDFGFDPVQLDLFHQLVERIEFGTKKDLRNFTQYMPMWRGIILDPAQNVHLYAGIAEHRMLRHDRVPPKASPQEVILAAMKRNGWKPPAKRKQTP